MKVLHVETGRHFYGGPQQVQYLLEGLQARGVSNVLACVPGSDVEAAARNAGVAVYGIPCNGDLDLVFAWWLYRVTGWESPDIIHCHSRRGADVLGGLAARAARVPAVLSRRVDNPESAWLASLRYRAFERIVAISDNVAASLAERNVDAARVTLIRSAVDCRRFEPAPDRAKLCREYGLDANHVLIAAAGQLIPRKGHRYLLEAMAGLSRARSDLELLVFGRGELEGELAEQAERLGLAGHVRFGGFRDDLDDYLGAFDILVHPALREGLGVSMLKAAAAGVPVIAFDVAGSREAVGDGQTGLLVTPKDTRALEHAIARLADDPGLRRSLGEAGRQRMREEFSIDTMVDQHVGLYEALLNGDG